MKLLSSIIILSLFCLSPNLAQAGRLPNLNPEPTRAMRYCTEAGTTYYCLLNLEGNTINGKTCSFGDINRNNGQAIEGGDSRKLDSCIQYCSDWACYYIKDQQESSGKPVVGSRCCNSSGWSSSR